jgi:hypothetical protein
MDLIPNILVGCALVFFMSKTTKRIKKTLLLHIQIFTHVFMDKDIEMHK